MKDTGQRVVSVISLLFERVRNEQTTRNLKNEPTSNRLGETNVSSFISNVRTFCVMCCRRHQKTTLVCLISLKESI